MVRRRFIDKRTATTFELVHRAQNDPLIHDENAPQMVLREVVPASEVNKGRRRAELDGEFSSDVRRNEGEAANHGIYYDDSKYDYMQHLREIGSGAGQSTWIDAPSVAGSTRTAKTNRKESLADAIDRDSRSVVSGLSLSSEASKQLVGEEMLPSDFVMPVSYQNQQEIPDDIAGFRPDMDPRLREVLEALNDDAYVDDNDDSMLQQLVEEGEAVDPLEWEDSLEDDGWESDGTVKAAPVRSGDVVEQQTADWMAEFRKYKRDAKSTGRTDAETGDRDCSSVIPASVAAESAAEIAMAGLPKPAVKGKRRKGAQTSTTSYSMTSSSIARTEALTTLDERFDRIEAMYSEAVDDLTGWDDAGSVMSGATGMSTASAVSGFSQAGEEMSDATRDRYSSVLDDFLSANPSRTRKRGKGLTPAEKAAQAKRGLSSWDDFRRELRPLTTANEVKR